MGRTSFLSIFFKARQREIALYKDLGDDIQRRQLTNLLQVAQGTEFGTKYGFSTLKEYRQFAANVPLSSYEELKPYVERIQAGEQNLIWPTSIQWFAKSSGTTNDKSKFIPITQESLNDCHYRAGKDCVALYLQANPESDFFSGKGLILGGSHDVKNLSSHCCFGDLSAVLIENLPALVNLIRVPEKEVALMSEWEDKLERIANSTMSENVTNLSGVPSWFLVLIKQMLKKSGKSYLTEIWPNLEVFFHGGISFDPYRAQYKELIPSDRMHYMETYNASEGFFGIQNDLTDPAMLLMLDLGIFYEFIPLNEVDSSNPTILPIWEVEVGKNYALVITTNGGLWRYQTGDTVKIASTSPLKITISGRTKHFINAFGEELMVDNAEKALATTCLQTDSLLNNYTAAPVYMSGSAKGKHQWLIEFEKLNVSVAEFAIILDGELQKLNSDYEAKRYKSLALEQLEIVEARKGLFHDWLKERNKLGGQHKIPRLSNTRQQIDDMLRFQ